MYLTDIAGFVQLQATTLSTGWISIPSHPRHEIDIATDRVRNRQSGYVLANRLVKSSVRRYWRCSIGLIHRLKMEALLARKLDTDEWILHANGDGSDNDIRNLRVGTAAQNARDKIRTNTNGIKLRNADIREIRQLAATMSQKQLAREYKVTVGHISHILSRRCWSNLP